MMLLMTLLVGDEGDDDSFRGWWCWLMVTVTRSKKTTAPWQEPSVYLQPGFGLVRKLPEPANRTFEKWSLFLNCLSTVSVWHTYANKKGTQNTDKHKHTNKVQIPCWLQSDSGLHIGSWSNQSQRECLCSPSHVAAFIWLWSKDTLYLKT